METHPTRSICSLATLVLAALAVVGVEPAARAGPDVRTPHDRADQSSSQPIDPPADRTAVDSTTSREPNRREREPYTVAVVSDMNGSYGSTDYADPVHRTVEWPERVVDLVARDRGEDVHVLETLAGAFGDVVAEVVVYTVGGLQRGHEHPGAARRPALLLLGGEVGGEREHRGQRQGGRGDSTDGVRQQRLHRSVPRQ
jgi:hypothetical protein